MAINDELIRWGENNEQEVTLDNEGNPVNVLSRVDPPSEVKSSGLKDEQPLTRQWYNHQQYHTWQIVKDLQEQINTLSVSGDNAALLQTIWQVGDIWMTQTEDNPASRFGFGTWEKQQGRYVVGSSTTDSEFTGVGKKGGTKTHTHGDNFSIANHTLSEAEVPSYVHSHSYRDRYHAESAGSIGGAFKESMPVGYNGNRGTNGTDTDNTQWLYYDSTTGSSTFGGGGAHKHNMTGGVQSATTLPPYETYHIWKRIA